MQGSDIFIDRAAGRTWVNISGKVLWEYSTIADLTRYYSLNKAVNNSGNFIERASRFVSIDLHRS